MAGAIQAFGRRASRPRLSAALPGLRGRAAPGVPVLRHLRRGHRPGARRDPDGVRAGALFGGPIADAIHALKYGDRAEAAVPLGRWLAGRVEVPRGARVVWVPLGRRRRIERGYDQAMLLAGAFSRAAGLRLLRGAMRRVRETPPQVGRDRAARARNVEGAFAASRAVTGLDLVLVDDVVTTGATAEAASRALREAGARQHHRGGAGPGRGDRADHPRNSGDVPGVDSGRAAHLPSPPPGAPRRRDALRRAGERRPRRRGIRGRRRRAAPGPRRAARHRPARPHPRARARALRPVASGRGLPRRRRRSQGAPRGPGAGALVSRVRRGVARQSEPGRGGAGAARVPPGLVGRRALRQRGAERPRARVPARGRARPRRPLSRQGARGGLAPPAARAGVPRHPRHRHGGAAAAGGGGLRAGRSRAGPPAAGPALGRRQRRLSPLGEWDAGARRARLPPGPARPGGRRGHAAQGPEPDPREARAGPGRDGAGGAPHRPGRRAHRREAGALAARAASRRRPGAAPGPRGVARDDALATGGPVSRRGRGQGPHGPRDRPRREALRGRGGPRAGPGSPPRRGPPARRRGGPAPGGPAGGPGSRPPPGASRGGAPGRPGQPGGTAGARRGGDPPRARPGGGAPDGADRRRLAPVGGGPRRARAGVGAGGLSVARAGRAPPAGRGDARPARYGRGSAPAPRGGSTGPRTPCAGTAGSWRSGTTTCRPAARSPPCSSSAGTSTAPSSSSATPSGSRPGTPSSACGAPTCSPPTDAPSRPRPTTRPPRASRPTSRRCTSGAGGNSCGRGAGARRSSSCRRRSSSGPRARS